MSRVDEGAIKAGDVTKPRPLEGVIAPPAWTEDALCTQFPADMWFPDGKGVPATDAKAVCRMCTVRQECLEYALAYESGQFGTPTSYAEQGVWGGLSPRERRKLQRARRSQPPTTEGDAA